MQHTPDGFWDRFDWLESGIAIGFVVARLVSHLIAAIDKLGLLAFVGSALMILIAAMVASAIPAFRAARVNAVEALRAE